MGFWSIVKISLRSIRSNKVRTGLTVLGIVIGIASVIIVYSAGQGVKGLIYSQVESFGGTDLIETEVKAPTGKKGLAAEHQSAIAIAQGAQITTLTLKDMADVSKLSNIKNAYAAILGQEQVNYADQSKKTFIFGTTASIIDIDKIEIDYGRYFSDTEDKSEAPVAVLGYKMKDKLFGSSDPLGKYIKIRKVKFRVIGVAKERGAIMTLDYDNFVYVPIKTLQKRILGIDHVMFMMHQVKNPDLVDQTAEEARIIIRANHDITSTPIEFKLGEPITRNIGEGMTDISKDDFRVVTMKESLAVLDTVTRAITLMLLAIVAISLVVGGVGVMNIMYVIITERTAEIGLRKAVGARFNDIMFQFLIESLIITLIGAVVGVLAGVGASYLISLAANYYGLDWQFLVPLKAYYVCLAFAMVFGLGFGLYPARKAARLDPIEALRQE
ncbi:ABC transporter permease [Patescibacteria group bacterium]|nr:ABC transporter permease [Patescibacteria group bacterium]MBU1663370.1 ABC transporter permease [Patescibacteria group bacterium]MBU1934341.1 ABC transporter permease [Patescibacteria group bacterium]